MQLQKFVSGESIYDASFREKLNAMVDALNAASTNSSSTTDTQRDKYTRAYSGIPVKITALGSSPGFFQFQEVWATDTSEDWYLRSDGLTHNELGEARCRGGWMTYGVTNPIVGRVVYLFPGLARNNNSKRIFEFESPDPMLFPILMEQTGGSAGSNTDPCDYTYTIKDIYGNTIAIGNEGNVNGQVNVDPTVDPHTCSRPALGALVAATSGIAYFGTNASDEPELRIVYCNETLDVSECA